MPSADPQSDTRQRLLDTARELFLQRGYTATGVADILKAADARSGSLYHFFPTKEDLLLAVLEQYCELLWPLVIQPVCERISDPIERVFGVLDGYRKMLIYTECSQGCPIGNLALELSDSHPAARQLIAANFSGWRDAIKRSLDDTSGRLPDTVSTEQLATFVLTTMEGAVMLARAYRSLEPYDAAITQLRDYFERLLSDGSQWTSPRAPAPSTRRQAAGTRPLGRKKT